MSAELIPVKGDFVYEDGRRCTREVYQWMSVEPKVTEPQAKGTVEIYYATIDNVRVKIA